MLRVRVRRKNLKSDELLLLLNLFELRLGGLSMTLNVLRQSCSSYIFTQARILHRLSGLCRQH